MNDSLGTSIAGSLDGNKDILPYLPELLQDLWSLGSPPERLLRILGPLNLPPGKTRVLDLGCGKGAVSVRLALDLGYQMVGIDGCPEFLGTARRKAAEFGVESSCKFLHADIRDFVKNARGFDVLILASVGSVLGGPRTTARCLGECVRPVGCFLVDDGYLRGRGSFRHDKPYDETLSGYLSYGDELVREVKNSGREVRRINESYLRDIRRRATGLIGRRPDLKALLEGYLRIQESECDRMNRNFQGATWLFRRVDH